MKSDSVDFKHVRVELIFQMIVEDAWGKCDRTTGEFHHLAHHSADVAAVFLDLIEQPHLRARANAAYGQTLSKEELRCIAALVFLHDVGKLAPGFQAKGWPDGSGVTTRGHLECGWLWLTQGSPESLGGTIAHMMRWSSAPGLMDWFGALFAHHGRPVPEPSPGKAGTVFPSGKVAGYDWKTEETVMGKALLDWFPEIRTSSAPEPVPALVHFFCGLLTLADWIGSDRRAFPFEPIFRRDYWATAKMRAADRVAAIGLSSGGLRLRGAPGWALISDHASPRPAQQAVGSVPATERLVLLEAETGSGKTEAALWRFATLLEAGEVDALYFAVPTRAAARQLHCRVNMALKRMFDSAPEAILAVPGQLLAGDTKGTRLPGFEVLWDDSTPQPARWAAEHAARYLAAQVAVGTVDQVALGGLRVKYAHLRGSALSRALVVIDEVHASDSYMTEVQLSMVRSHLALGGHAMLMSATLGAAARRKWLNEAPADLASDVSRPYPAVWTRQGPQAVAPDRDAGKEVHVEPYRGWTGDEAAALATEAAASGARVLVIRNTVIRAQETFAACHAVRSDLLLSVDGQPTLHHSRFATEDRALLDMAVEDAIGKDSPIAGHIVIGTQTLEQSLDLCADLLITDLCPMDVLLQRIGRLHRHRRPRPQGFERARAIVMCPPDGLDPLTRAAENGLGAYAGGPSLSGIYFDLPGLAATLAEIEGRRVWQVPAMNRALVEAATHPEALDRIAEARGWQAYRQRVTGKALAEMQAADLVMLDREAPLPRSFPDDEKIRTRLGEDGVVLSLPKGALGAFGQPITRLALPAHWSRGLTGEEDVEIDQGPPIRVTVSDRVMAYGPEGLVREQGETP